MEEAVHIKSIGELDSKFVAALISIMIVDVSRKYANIKITLDQFCNVMNDGLRDKVNAEIKDYFHFMGKEIVVDITDDNWFNVYNMRVE